MGRISHGRRRQRAVMSRVALEHNVRRAEARRRREEEDNTTLPPPVARSPSPVASTSTSSTATPPASTSSNNVTPLPVSNWESSAALRKSLLATKIPSLSPVCQKKEIINSSVLSDMAHIIKCSVCEGQCVVKRKHLLSGYYGTTVRRFVQKGGDKTRVSELASEIMASFLHVTSSDKDPRHFLCPSAEDSWCFYKRALANEETPPSHNTMKVKITITCKEDRQAIALVYQDLTRHDLLERCMKGRTQNVNESFHSKLWKKCVKVKFHGNKKVEFAFKMAALEHNCGYKSGTLLDKILGGDPTARGLNLQEEGRLTSSAKKSLKRRKRRKVEEEGESDYVPGGY
ncbi:hypothetical protein Pcinc_022544 [Petrolisthes cinctipes]|uniref:Uncharacterized protein n=1 Tax=Petrolisthes cinctipes TaxID=88211 RepID=A0AAE1FEG9_PETCI|nr:hypothetical protein Pcinc_022544 [Petrolisthes cinctipes]